LIFIRQATRADVDDDDDDDDDVDDVQEEEALERNF
jgi:hypothetical protein